MIELLKELSNMRGISGYEYKINEQIKALFKPFADETYIDTLGNIIAIKKSKKPNAKKIMLEAHCDEIGLMVKDIDKNGFITFVNIGGVDTRILPSAEVVVHGKKDIDGVIISKPPHLQTDDESKKNVSISDLAIDIGYDEKNAKNLVCIGDSITLSSNAIMLSNSQFCSKTLDDRAGVASVLKCFELISDKSLDVDVYAVIAVQEEVGCRGAKTATYAINPDVAIVVDVCHGITHDNSENSFELGKGCVISVGPNIHRKLAKHIEIMAKNNDIKYQIDVDGGDTGTDAWVIQVVRSGIPTALLSIPLKYMHTSVEVLSISDVEELTKLMVEVLLNIDVEGLLCY